MSDFTGIDIRLEWFGNKVMAEFERTNDERAEAAAANVRDEAQRRLESVTTTRTGQAVKSIVQFKSKFQDGGYVVLARGREGWHYKFIELGAPKRGLPAHQPLRGALYAEQQRFYNDVKRSLGKLVE